MDDKLVIVRIILIKLKVDLRLRAFHDLDFPIWRKSVTIGSIFLDSLVAVVGEIVHEVFGAHLIQVLLDSDKGLALAEEKTILTVYRVYELLRGFLTLTSALRRRVFYKN